VSTPHPRELFHFAMLDEAEKVAAIKRMARNGWSLEGISRATRISVERLRLIIGAPQ
jgi:hypothetical protein